MNKVLYPLKFKSTYHYRIWGGEGLKNYVDKPINEPNIGESWEISTVPGFVSIVENGVYKGRSLNDLIDTFKDSNSQFLGSKVSTDFGANFPLLIKFIDSEAPLSVQVHPDDKYAQKHHCSFGKTEMWYIMRAEPDSELIIGFKEGTDKAKYLDKLQQESLEDILRTVEPKTSEVYFIPAGRVHAIGKGVTLAEIQQNSDITYRIYDYNRKDKEGNLRELHTDKALQVSDFSFIENPKTEYHHTTNHLNLLIESDYFMTSKLVLDQEWKSEFSQDSFTIYMGVKGEADFIFEDVPYSLNLGETLLIPAGIQNHKIVPNSNCEILVVRV